MLDRVESISRVLCWGLGALLLLQVVNAVWHGDPLGRVTIPNLPTLAAESVKTNEMPAAQAVAIAKTNAETAMKTPPGQTNSGANRATAANVKTNAAPMTNETASVKTNSLTNAVAAAAGKTNSAAPAANSEPVAKAGRRRPGMPPMMGMPMGGPKVELPADIQARVDRIVHSEILGPFIRPMPMALLGIAGDDAFLRAPDGQTGMIKEGAELGTIKLLRIGTNRVLVEENGEKKELTLFAGMGGESLLPPETNSAAGPNPAVNKKETH